MSENYESFGRFASPARHGLSSQWAIARLMAGEAEPNSLLAYGNGRSYGDSCLNPRGLAVDMRDLNRILEFDAETGILRVEAGALLSDVIAQVAPRGCFPPAVPGTQHVTIGGAIANDVHGKNHHRRGTFGAHVRSFKLLRSDGRVRDCSRSQNPDLFAATIGGMGLTGLILSAEISMMRVTSVDVAERVTAFRTLDAYFELAEAADQDNEYAVAWIDQLATGYGFGRGLLLAGNHAETGRYEAPQKAARLSVPFTPPFTVLNQPFLKVFNTAYRLAKGRAAGTRISDFRSFFFPLDGVGNWNRLYGPRGLHQHQSVIPFEAAPQTIPAMLAATQKAGQGSFLTVLKRFGAVASPGILSFPRPGYTLTLDFPHRGERTLALLAELDRMTVAAGGAVNPYKDARMSEHTFAASFPQWRKLQALRDPAFSSGFWERTACRLARDDGHKVAAA
ncbi:FAD-binding oxidoreductase [Arvimicrobium flavum]|uniref:FAD-binding oxidoreductase n=1 Tax=Arvimicrobium flavum TaxID=3393320 RepID=UPI00237C20F4|nr:FAD-binding oxidoreductase [Mesorhizobium shangrilense]